MIMAKISLDILQPTIEKLLMIKTEQFWSYESLTPKEKRCFYSEMKLFVLLNSLLWLFTLIIIIIVIMTRFVYAKFIFNENWPFVYKIIFKICFSVFAMFGYITGNAVECYYVYVLLNNYFQIKLVIVFMRSGMAQEGLRQNSVRKILKRTIRQFQRLKLWTTIKQCFAF